MQATLGSRKRPAPGASPVSFQRQQPQPQPQPQLNDASQLTDEQFLSWDGPLKSVPTNAYADPSLYSPQVFNAGFATPVPPVDVIQLGPTPSPVSNQLVRRNTNQQVAPRQQWQAVNNNDDLWADFGGALGAHTGVDQSEQDEELDQRAAAIKRQALAERKQIPPFILKLSSFLDEPKYSDLIRWAQDGKSFIVLDEDEFGKKVIPERFKHNNYASFVRQLNMYGFHKNVGLSDNSMRSSENKTKSPSQYAHPYFRQGKPDYLWLIKKPKNAVQNSKRKKEGAKDQESDDDSKRYGSVEREEEGKPAVTDDRVGTGGGGRSQEVVTLPKSELAAIQQELETIQRSQRFISTAIHRLREQNNQLYQQASAFQTLHDRHENSINAILTFLATFYNRSLEGYGTQNMANLFNHDVPHKSPQHGGVFNVGEGVEGKANASTQAVRPGRRPQLLLPAPVGARQRQDGLTPGTVSTAPVTPSAATTPTSTRLSPSPQREAPNLPYRNQAPRQNLHVARKPASVRSKSAEPPPASVLLKQNGTQDRVPESQDMLSVITNLNLNTANNSAPMSNPSLEFSSALRHFENSNGNAPLTTEQRSNMLNLLAVNTGNTSASNNAIGILGGASSALTSPLPPPAPDLNQFAATREELEVLQRLQEEQDAKMQSLADRLQPLSPSGSIPGFPSNSINTAGNSNNQNAGDFDLGSFINDVDYFATQPGDANMALGNAFSDGDINFDFDGAGVAGGDWAGFGNGAADGLFGDEQGSIAVDGGGGRVESIASSETTSPATTAVGVDDVQSQKPSEEEGGEGGSPLLKKRKRG